MGVMYSNSVSLSNRGGLTPLSGDAKTPAMVLAYLDLLKADQSCIEKFGDAYRHYMERVPRVNFLAGIIRLVRRSKSGK